MVAGGSSVTIVGASDTVSVTAAVESRVTASVVPTLAGSTASVPPGGGVAELRGSPFVGLTLMVEAKPVADSVAAYVKRPHKTINI